MPNPLRSAIMRRFAACAAVALGIACGTVAATEVELVGRMGSRAVLQIDGGTPRIVAIGSVTQEGVRLVAIEGNVAILEIEGRRTRATMGQSAIRIPPVSESARVVLYADARGHYLSEGRINGAPVRLLVDTGATLVALGKSDAARVGIDYERGTPATLMTAAGRVDAWRVTIDALQIGSMTLRNVEGVVQENDLPVVLLGMSVLNRLEMRQEGRSLTLEKKH